jgi:hypothetical protein
MCHTPTSAKDLSHHFQSADLVVQQALHDILSLMGGWRQLRQEYNIARGSWHRLDCPPSWMSSKAASGITVTEAVPKLLSEKKRRAAMTPGGSRSSASAAPK